MKKKTIYTITVLILISLFCFMGLSGCADTGEESPGPGESAAPQDETPSGASATVRFAGFSAGEQYGQTLQDMLDLFADAYPQITVIDESAGYGDYYAELAADIGSGSAPDVFELDCKDIIDYMRRDAITPLAGLAASSHTDLGVYQKGLIDRLCSASYTLMALPFSYSSVVLVYNMDLFDQAGVAYPSTDWLWEDQLLAAQKITRPEEDIWGYYYEINDVDDFYTKMVQNDDRFYTGKGKFTLNSNKNVETLQWLQDLIWVYRVMPTEAERAGREAADLFAEGKLGMFTADAGTFADLSERCGGIRWGVEVAPGNKRKATQVSCNVLCINSVTEVSDAAYALVHFLSSDPDVQRLRLEAGWDLPPVSGASVMDAYLEGTPPANKAAVMESTEYALIPQGYRELELLLNEFLPPYLETVRDNEEIPVDALAAAQAEAERRTGLSQQ